jgi:hypothetical protein
MAEIQRTLPLPFPAAQCYDGVRRIWPLMGIKVTRSDPAARMIEGRWDPGGVILVFRCECREAGEGAAEVSLRNDPQWTPVLSRPNIASASAAQKYSDQVLARMDGILAALEKYLQEGEPGLPVPSSRPSLELDHLAWAAGAVISAAFRLLAGWLGPLLVVSLQGTEQQSAFQRAVGALGVLIGAVAAGLVKRRNPAKGSAFFEGFIVAIACIWLNMMFYRTYFTMGCADWAFYFVVGGAFAALGAMRVSRKPK